jgi:hypothetical protein
MREVARPGLTCLLAIAAALSAPACLARQAASQQPVDAVEAAPAELQPVVAEESPEPRSAFGRVMSIMIAALKQNADAPPARTPVPRLPDQAAPSATPVHRIQVGAAFRLDEASVAAESSSPPSPTAD